MMKRMFAKLLSFLLMVIMITAVVCRISANFPAVYKITKVAAECNENGSWVMYTNRTGEKENILTVPFAGRLMEDMSEPIGFSICTAAYLMLLFMGRKKTPRRTSSEECRYSCDYGWESDEDVSVSETVSLSETS